MERMEGAWKGWRESVERMEEECGKDGGRVWKGWRVRGKDGGRVWKGWRERVERMEGERGKDGGRAWKGWRVHGCGKDGGCMGGMEGGCGKDGGCMGGMDGGCGKDGGCMGGMDGGCMGGMEGGCMGGCGKDGGRVWEGWREGVERMGTWGGDLCCSFILKACLHIYINVPQDKAYMCVCCV